MRIKSSLRVTSPNRLLCAPRRHRPCAAALSKHNCTTIALLRGASLPDDFPEERTTRIQTVYEPPCYRPNRLIQFTDAKLNAEVPASKILIKNPCDVQDVLHPLVGNRMLWPLCTPIQRQYCPHHCQTPNQKSFSKLLIVQLCLAPNLRFLSAVEALVMPNKSVFQLFSFCLTGAAASALEQNPVNFMPCRPRSQALLLQPDTHAIVAAKIGHLFCFQKASCILKYGSSALAVCRAAFGVLIPV